KIQLEREQKEVELQSLQLSDLQTLLSEDPELEKDVKQALQDMGVPAALSSLSDLNQAIADVNSLQGRIVGLVVGLFKGPNRGLVILLLVLVLGLPVLGSWLYHQFSSSFVVIGTIVAEVTAFIGGGVALLRKAADYVQQHVGKVEAAKRR